MMKKNLGFESPVFILNKLFLKVKNDYSLFLGNIKSVLHYHNQNEIKSYKK